MLAFTLPPIVADHLSWWVAGLIIFVGLLVIGIKDTLRFSLSRAWAISGVVRAESIRKKVLLIAPLAMLGVVVVTQLQRPFDEQDAIRQTTKFCLFATGLVVAITAIILACTNLPKEIDNRVIYTVVTKPTTRLEIILGKVIGFARVSLLILIIMGAFTFGYLHLRAYAMQRDIAARLDRDAVDPVSRPTLEHYRDAGLLNAKHRVEARDVQIFSRTPRPGETVRWMAPGDQDLLVPFDIDPQHLIVPIDETQTPGAGGLLLLAWVNYTQRAPTTQEWEQMPEGRAAAAVGATQPIGPPVAPGQLSGELGPTLPSTQPTTAPAPPPMVTPAPFIAPADRPMPPAQITINILNAARNVLLSSQGINGGRPIALPASGSRVPAQARIEPEQAIALASRLSEYSPENRRIYLQVSGVTPGVEYAIPVEFPPPVKYAAGGVPFVLAVPTAPNQPVRIIPPARDDNDRPIPPSLRGRIGTFGQQLKGAAAGDNAPVAVYSFRGADFSSATGDTVPLEVRIGIERTGDTSDKDRDNPTQLSFEIQNHKTGQASKLITVTPETNRTSYLRVPRDAVEGGDFDVVVRCMNAEQWIGLKDASVTFVPSQQPFAANLGKSLLILWLMSILVVVISIFCSTFLSWPIAIVLTVVLLLGHWGVQQLADPDSRGIAPGIGNQIANDLGFRGDTAAAKAKVVSSSVEALAKFLNILSSVLPDVSRFSATEDIERGLIIPWSTVRESLAVLLGFGLPTAVLAYVFMKFKEVAP